MENRKRNLRLSNTDIYITIEVVDNEYVAYLTDDPEACEYGRTPEEALGKLLLYLMVAV